jgi:uncharacterized protein YggU (UPF0235/DUF167 family)
MYLSVRVVAGQKKEGVEALKDGRLKVSVKPPAKAGRANARALELVAAHLKLPPSTVRIVSGHASPAKLFAIPDERHVEV